MAYLRHQNEFLILFIKKLQHPQQRMFTSSTMRLGRAQLSGRRRGERVDSVTPEILEERKHNLERINESLENDDDISEEIFSNEFKLTQTFKKMGLGRKKIGSDQKRLQFSEIGAQGSTAFLGSCTKPPWPRFKHMLPEIALAGHSNSGKSTLLNSLVGMTATRGPARVSDRAGWTDALFWYQVGAKPPKMSLVDLPGYGHAVASSRQLATWDASTKAYLETRRVLTRCCVLVDSTRGLCKEDKELISFLMNCNTPYQIVLTKADLLSPAELARCVTLVREDVSVIQTDLQSKMNTNRSKRRRQNRSQILEKQPNNLETQYRPSPPSSSSSNSPPKTLRDFIISPPLPIAVVSGHTGAGVNNLYKELFEAASKVSVKDGVPIHINAVK